MERSVLCVFGTRPEAIKMAPVIERLRESRRLRPVVAVTAQHREMLDQVLGVFGIEPDIDLDIMRPRQTLTQVTTRALEGLSQLLERQQPDAMLVQGDTTTTLAGALAAFYHRVPVGHVEAGLRSLDLSQPYPEEMNRRLTTRLARWHFAPTGLARDRLLAEGVAADAIHVTGNTVIDALLETAGRTSDIGLPVVDEARSAGRRIVLVTVHRRENWGPPIRDICRAIARITESAKDVQVVVSVHPNPAVSEIVRAELGARSRVALLEPLDYAPFVKLMSAATLVLTDSGGIQEEAPSLDVPVLVLREVTERPEAVEAGAALIVGTDTDRVATETLRLLGEGDDYARMAAAENPFGDGTAAQQIVDVLARELD